MMIWVSVFSTKRIIEFQFDIQRHLPTKTITFVEHSFKIFFGFQSFYASSKCTSTHMLL
jgi:hypothetical protein